MFVYFSVEQSLIAGNLAASRQALSQNNVSSCRCEIAREAWRAHPYPSSAVLTDITSLLGGVLQAIRTSNEELEEAKAELQDEEDELVNMYSKWLDDDNEELDISTEELETLKSQFKDMQESLTKHTQGLESKETSLAEKEKRLKVRVAAVDTNSLDDTPYPAPLSPREKPRPLLTLLPPDSLCCPAVVPVQDPAEADVPRPNGGGAQVAEPDCTEHRHRSGPGKVHLG